jgi:hypothetical protein
MFTWLGAAVEIPKIVWKLLSTLGFKIYFYRPDMAETSDDSLLNEYLNNDFRDKIEKIENYLYNYLKTFDAAPSSKYVSRLPENEDVIQIKCDKTNLSEDQRQAIRYIAKTAILLSHLRAPVEIYAAKRVETLRRKNKEANFEYQEIVDIVNEFYENEDYDEEDDDFEEEDDDE